MIVGDDESIARLFADFADATDPRRQLLRRIEIVVALMSGNFCIVAEPSVVAPPVKPDVPDSRGSFSRWHQRSPDDGLVDVAEAHSAGAQQFQRLRRIPGAVAH